ncbi:MAG: ABC transporter permease [Bacteroidaceae bacterium]|nr:ABC transporter permease [Bacteroidaceae bacterium]
MHLTNLFKIALRAIAANKLRSFLTMLGIIIGVAAVIAMIAIGEGSKESIQSNIASMGSNMISINPGADRRAGGVRQDASSMETLKLKDYELLKTEAKLIKAISPTVSSSGQCIFGNNNTPSSMYGVSIDYLDIRQLKIEEGDMFTEEDIRTSAKVCIIGKTVADNLFTKGEDPVGRVIRFKSIPFRVVGVLKSKGYNTFGMDQDNLILAPYTTVMKRIMAITYLNSISVSALTEEHTEEAIEELTALLRQSHKLREGIDEDNFNIHSQKEIMEMMNSTADVMTTLLLCVACISLIVGGIGIMNIMYVSVTERTKEIGLRMSVGARGIDILAQFLIEAVFLSVTGGLIGVVVGCLISNGVATLAQWPVSIQPWSIMLSFAVCTFTGIFFGWYPAKKAANLDPIEALRYE